MMSDGMEFQLVEEGRISGIVLAKVDLQPVARAAVQATLVSGPALGLQGPVPCKTDGTGAFQFTRLRPGTYTAIVSSPDFADKGIERLSLAENQGITDLTIELSKGGSFVGTVRDYAGKPVPNAILSVTRPGGQKLAQADNEGNYAVRNLEEGRYYATAIGDYGVSGMSVGSVRGGIGMEIAYCVIKGQHINTSDNHDGIRIERCDGWRRRKP